MEENRIIQGEEYLCVKNIKILGIEFFIKGKKYKSRYDNTLYSEEDESVWITGRNVIVDYFGYFEKQ